MWAFIRESAWTFHWRRQLSEMQKLTGRKGGKGGDTRRLGFELRPYLGDWISAISTFLRKETLRNDIYSWGVTAGQYIRTTSA